MNDFRYYQGMDFSDFLAHYGVGHLDGGNSGRYKWGSGERPWQRTSRDGQSKYKVAKDKYKAAKKAYSRASDDYRSTLNSDTATQRDKRNADRYLTMREKELAKAKDVFKREREALRVARKEERKRNKEAKASEKANKTLDKKEGKLENVTDEDINKLTDKELADRVARIKQEDAYRQSIGQDILSKLRRDKDSVKGIDKSISRKEDKLSNISNKEIGEMTDKELNDRIARLRQEDTYRQLIGQKTLSQLRKERDMPKEIAKGAMEHLVKSGINSLIDKVIIPAATGHVLYSLAQGRRDKENAEIRKWNEEHPDEQKELKSDVDYVQTVFRDAKFYNNGQQQGKGKKNKGNKQQGDTDQGEPQGKNKQSKEKETSNASLKDVANVTKDMVDMSGAKGILEGATKRMEKEKAKESEKAQKAAVKADKTAAAKDDGKAEEYRSWKDVDTKKDNGNTDDSIYADKRVEKQPKVSYDYNNSSTYETEGSSSKPYKWDRATREATAGYSTFKTESKRDNSNTDDSIYADKRVEKQPKVSYDYNNSSTYETEGSSSKPYKWDRATREATAGYSTFSENNKPTASSSTSKSKASSQKLDIFYDSNPGQFNIKEQREFASAIASAASALRSIGSEKITTRQAKESRRSSNTSGSSDSIGRLKQDKDAWDAIANSVSRDVLENAEKISKDTTAYTKDMLERSQKTLKKYGR